MGAIIGILLGSAALSMSFSLINASLATIEKQLQASLIELQWMINIYGIFIASTLVTMGRFGDIFGRKKVYIIGMALLALAMCGAGLAPSPSAIIGFMALYGLSGAIILPLSQALMIDAFDETKKNRAIGIWATVSALAMAAGPVVGGYVSTHLDWRWIFFINIPGAIAAGALVYWAAEESSADGESTHIDWPGMALLILTIGTLILAVIQSNIWSLSVTITLLIVSAVALTLLLIVENKVEMPIIREDLFTRSSFLFSALSAFCMTALFWAALFVIPLYVQRVLGYSPIKAGILMLFYTLPGAFLSSPSAHLYEKMGARIQICSGFCLCVIATIMFLQFGHVSPFWHIALATMIMAIGFTLILTPAMAAGFSTVSRNAIGVATGTFVTVQEIGGSLGLALTVTIIRMHRGEDLAFHHGVWVMFTFALIGVVGSLLLRENRPKQTEPEKRDYLH